MSTPATGVFHAIQGDRSRSLEGVPLAGIRARAVAFLIDLAVVVALFGLTALPGALRDGAADPAGRIVVSIDLFDSLRGLLLLVAYFGVATFLGKGQTPGKRLQHIRVVSLVHDRLTLWHSVERALGYAASALEGGFGFIQYFMHPNRQTVHDRIAETIVIVDPGSGAGP
ncbi:MAG: RDD family protein [Gammaproteobacteria bacterium]|nr:RDD family protein [Gammaproteobacteria bacterium]